MKNGFTLIEVLIAVIMVGLAIAALVGANLSFTKANGMGANISTAEFLSEQIRELTTMLAVVDPQSGTATFGAEEGSLANYDDIDDFDGAGNGLTFNPPITSARSALTDFASYSQKVTVKNVNPANLRQMHKGFNTMRGGYEVALANLRRHGIRLYATFILGYDADTEDTIKESLAFALRHKFYIVAFNHLTPFPGTPLYDRLQHEGRLLYDRWWLDSRYRYGDVPFRPHGMTSEQVRYGCIQARAEFYRLSSIVRRSFDRQVNGENVFMWTHFFMINWMIRREVKERAGFPLGDEAYRSELLPVRELVCT